MEFPLPPAVLETYDGTHIRDLLPSGALRGRRGCACVCWGRGGKISVGRRWVGGATHKIDLFGSLRGSVGPIEIEAVTAVRAGRRRVGSRAPLERLGWPAAGSQSRGHGPTERSDRGRKRHPRRPQAQSQMPLATSSLKRSHVDRIGARKAAWAQSKVGLRARSGRASLEVSALSLYLLRGEGTRPTKEEAFKALEETQELPRDPFACIRTPYANGCPVGQREQSALRVPPWGDETFAFSSPNVLIGQVRDYHSHQWETGCSIREAILKPYLSTIMPSPA